MKRLVSRRWIYVIVLIICWGCNDSSSTTGPGGQQQQAPEKRQFVWNAMNYWYYWQPDKPKLADNHSYFDNDQDFQSYLESFDDAESLFQDLRYKTGDVDRFSFFIPDYEDFFNRNHGVYAATGLKYTIITFQGTNNAVGYVRYIVPDSPADKAGAKRGNLFTKVNGEKLTANNYTSLLTGHDSYTFTLATVKNEKITETDKKYTVQSQEVDEDPVFLHSVIDTSGTKIGYLVYNAFQNNTHEELNQVMGDFKAKGIDVLVLDLRYNGGGAVITSQTLSSMIGGLGSTDEFAELSYIKKRSSNDETLNYLDKVPIADANGNFNTDGQGNFENTIPMKKLHIKTLYVLTSFATASASEALINGLKPFMDVKLVGGKTTGKDEGSLTLFDAPSPYLDKEKANPDHKIALQPIVLQITNKNKNHYSDGFRPDYKVDEIDYLLSHHAKLPPLGSPEDPLLAKAISNIMGRPMSVPTEKSIQTSTLRNWEVLMSSDDLYPHSKGMFIEPSVARQFLQKK